MTALDYRSAAAPSDEKNERSRGHWLLWAIYLAMSWTWCIGMFLPVLLVRDYGVWGWVVFAIPNVVGAAAMGWVLRRSSVSQRLLESHQLASFWFTIVTIVFQLFFSVWFVKEIAGELPLDFGLLLVVAVFVLGWRQDLWSLLLAIATLAASATFFLIGVRAHEFPYLLTTAPVRPHSELWSLGVVCGFGFVLCPYLDRTFHRARQQTSRWGGRAAFTTGFCFFFAAMILLTLGYSGWVGKVLRGGDQIPFFVGSLIGWHMAVQMAFTVGAHAREIAQPSWRSVPLLGSVLIVGVLVGTWAVDHREDYVSFAAGEFVYRLFMSFYGLVFPAYVWLCMIPGRWVTPPTGRQLVLWAVAVVVAAPMFWTAFIRGQMVWAVPGVCLVLLSRLAVGRTPRATLA